ncbi:MAG: hypothetical protein HUJ56_05800 [Erysipelotrichaceae bacterium]|nr:hypothetical protein [Erysipelotrichaceae bacterium]
MKQLFSRKRLMSLMVMVMVLMVSVGTSLSYFTAYTSAWGTKTLSLVTKTEVQEDMDGQNKEITILNTSEKSSVFVRVKIFFTNSQDTTCEIVPGEGWELNEKDGFYYYTKALKPGEATTMTKANVEVKTTGDVPADATKTNIVVANEYVLAIYDEKGNADQTLSWENYKAGGDQ